MKKKEVTMINFSLKRFIELFKFIAIIAVIGFTLIACNGALTIGNPFAKDPTYEITFHLTGGNINGDTGPIRRTARSGAYSCSGFYESPQREGYSFERWYYEQGTSKIEFGTRPIYSDLDVWAEWKTKVITTPNTPLKDTKDFTGIWKGKKNESPYEEGILTFGGSSSLWVYEITDPPECRIMYLGAYTVTGNTATMRYTYKSYNRGDTLTDYNGLPSFSITITDDGTIFAFGITFTKQP